MAARTRVLILQHPQESRNPLGTARLASLALAGAVHRVGLSWRSLETALGEPADPSAWGVLYVGTREGAVKGLPGKPVTVATRSGRVVSLGSLQGIVLLDGNWKQAKALWWRNPWLTRLNRVILNPDKPSAFNRVARQPRRQNLCTLEAAAFSLRHLEGSETVAATLESVLARHLERVEAGGVSAVARRAERPRRRRSSRPSPKAG